MEYAPSQSRRPAARLRKPSFWPLSIQAYLVLMNLVLLCLLFPALTYFFLRTEMRFRDSQLQQTIEQLRHNLETKASSVAYSLALNAGQALAGYEFTSLAILFREVAANDPEMLYAMIMSPERKALVHSDPERMGATLYAPVDLYAAEVLEKSFAKHHQSGARNRQILFQEALVSRNGREVPVMEVLAPIYNGARLWGVLRCGYSLLPLRQRLGQVEQEWSAKLSEVKRYAYTLSAIFFTLGMAVALLFTRFFLHSVEVLKAGVTRVASGDLDHPIPQNRLACAEFVQLSQAFNDMTAELKKSYAQLDEYSRSLEEKVEERTQKLREAQRNLLQQAHEAGMAEMAVGILHNIGNAITPAKVAASLMLKRLNDNPASQQLERAMEQLREVVDQCPSLPPEERQRLQAITSLLPRSLQEELNRIRNEVQRIETNHRHIEQIIGLQMRYARLSGTGQTVDLVQVVEDALSMFADSLNKQQVRVEKHLERVPPVRIEQAKLIQVVINLIKNGYEAMVDTPPPARLLVVSTAYEPGEPGMVVLTVRDSGAGFTPEQETRLFSFGYSTKRRGSGFGLHSCANFLIANHGSITASSPGPGQGAEFVIRLPEASARQPEEENHAPASSGP